MLRAAFMQGKPPILTGQFITSSDSKFSDPVTMMETVKKAKLFGVKVGAHPGLPGMSIQVFTS